jgi:hypothetical protein
MTARIETIMENDDPRVLIIADEVVDIMDAVGSPQDPTFITLTASEWLAACHAAESAVQNCILSGEFEDLNEHLELFTWVTDALKNQWFKDRQDRKDSIDRSVQITLVLPMEVSFSLYANAVNAVTAADLEEEISDDPQATLAAVLLYRLIRSLGSQLPDGATALVRERFGLVL